MSPYHSTNYDTVCLGGSYTWGGQVYTVSGVYTVNISNRYLCDSVKTLHLTVNYPPVRPRITEIGDTLFISMFSGIHYQWQRNGVNIPGATSSSIIAPTQGLYSVVATDGNGCTSYSDTIQIYNVGIPTIATIEGINLYPNPNKGSFTLESVEQIGSTYLVYDMLGQTIMQNTISSDAEHIDMGDAAPGVYTLMIKGKNGSVRFTVMR